MTDYEQKGAFALLDCLGFKGIWRRYDPQEIVYKLKSIEDLINRICSPLISSLAVIESTQVVAKAKLLSDTVALSVKFRTNSQEMKEQEHYLVNAMCLIVCQINKHFLQSSPHLVLRGCITFDEHLVEENFIIGPAVDRAAEYEKLPNGAFVWLDPSADELYQQNCSEMTELAESPERLKDLLGSSNMTPNMNLGILAFREVGIPPTVVTDYPMPIKGGETLKCSVLNPLAQDSHPETRRALCDTYVQEMLSNKLDVLIKKQNTTTFLESCEELTEAYYSRLVKSMTVRQVNENE